MTREHVLEAVHQMIEDGIISYVGLPGAYEPAGPSGYFIDRAGVHEAVLDQRGCYHNYPIRPEDLPLTPQQILECVIKAVQNEREYLESQLEEIDAWLESLKALEEGK